MTPFIIVVDNPDRWPLEIPEVQVVAARKYLTDPEYNAPRRFKVLNMCRSYRYQSIGYYVSLLAEARGHRPLPSTSTTLDFRSQSIIKSVSSELDELIQKSLAPLHSDRFTLSIYFARNLARRYDRLSRALFNLFPAPLLRAQFVKSDNEWILQTISPIATSELQEDHRPYVVEFAREHFARKKLSKPARKKYRFDLAILVDENETTPPSNEKALRHFQRAAEAHQISTEFITTEDFGSLVEFDGLFIRQTTAVNHLTYKFARRADQAGMVVIDDPESILRCTNKVYLAELLEKNKIPAPRTIVIHKDNILEAMKVLGLPCILKQPDSSFSQGVVKAKTEEDYREKINQLLETSDLIVGQEYLPTDFDWRIGIIDRKPLYACRYYMARGHWQIYNHSKKGSAATGNVDTLKVEDVPPLILEAAMKAANLIGDGLYGVDLKEINGKPYIIEVNDNPSIDAGIEDDVLKDGLYDQIMSIFLKRMEAKRERQTR